MALKIAVLISGGGSNMLAIAERVRQGALGAEIVAVIADSPRAAGLAKAADLGLPTTVVDFAACPARADFDAALLAAIQASGAEAVCLAGFMKLLGPSIIQAYPNRVLNIHPALLPSFKGLRGQKQAAEYGVRIAGCTVHFVDEGLDSGPIIAQAALTVPPGESEKTLMARILELEHRVYPQAIHWLAQGRLAIHDRTVHLTPARTEPAPDADVGALFSPPLEEGF